jgi:hypothetical protein
MAEAQRITGINHSSISVVCQGKSRRAGGYVWCYKEDFTGLPMRKTAKCKSIIQYDLSGNAIKRFESAKDAAEEVGALVSSISNACAGRTQTCKNFKWKYEEKLQTLKKDEFERWITLDDYPLYKISRDGRIYSKRCKRTTKLGDKSGYKIAYIRDKSGKNRKMYVHRLVALAYIPNPSRHPIVNHIDGNPSNNTVENLEWCTQSQNAQHAHDTGLNTTKKAVLKMNIDGNVLVRYNSLKEAAKSAALSRSIISAVCRGRAKHKTAGGFYWKYADAQN